ncbi:MAG: hypothetical protein ACPGN3_12540, partial [Opitutales bacterium]
LGSCWHFCLMAPIFEEERIFDSVINGRVFLCPVAKGDDESHHGGPVSYDKSKESVLSDSKNP